MDGLANFMTKLEPVLHSLFTFSQIVVAAVTVVYIARKTMLIPGKDGKTGQRGRRGQRGRPGTNKH